MATIPDSRCRAGRIFPTLTPTRFVSRLKQAALGLGLAAACSLARADPPILPPNDLDGTPPPVFCFQVTGASHSGDGVQIQFQVLNWNDHAAHDLEVSLDERISTGGPFAGASVNPGPIGNKYGGLNDWTVDSATPSSARWVAGTPLAAIDLYTGLGINGIEPRFGNGQWLTPAQLPSPIDSGINALDGFRLNLPDFEVGERVVFNWSFTDLAGPIADISSNGGFNRGIFQIDRGRDGPAGEIRFSAFLSIGTDSSSIPANAPPVDLAVTDELAVAVAPLIPEPGTVDLLLAGTGLLAAGLRARRRKPSH